MKNNSQIIMVPLCSLLAHEANSNVMNDAMLNKLCTHIKQTSHYPALIVRPMPGEAGVYQVLDGHHRWKALEKLKHTEAMCQVWDVDDEQALVFLATLNRLQGSEDPAKRATLLGQLYEKLHEKMRGKHRNAHAALVKLLPDRSKDVKKLLGLTEARPRLKPAPRLADMPMSVHFFLTGEQKKRLEVVLKKLGGSREVALMKMVERAEGMGG